MPTTKQLRREIRDQLGVAIFGRLPLRSREIEKAYEQIADEKPDDDWTAAKTRFLALGEACKLLDEEHDREPFDAQQPYRKPELQLMYDALKATADDDSTDAEATAAAGGDPGA